MIPDPRQQRLERIGELSAWVALAFIAILGLVFVVLCFRVAPTAADLSLNLTLLITGLILGWLSGMLLSPSSTREQGQFGVAAKAISTFASGYLLAKIDPLINALLNPKALLEASSVLPAFRVAMVVAAFAGMFLHIYILRVYILHVEPDSKDPALPERSPQ